MRTSLVLIVALSIIAGCPQAQNLNNSPVTPVIGVSQTSGSAPLAITVTAVDSSSTNEGPLSYAWDFGDGTTATEMATTHTYTNPGRYVLALTVTDVTGASNSTSETIRAQGGDVVAVISADVSEGTRPLVVNFDATQTQVTDDTILDYYWDFGDGGTSREAQPQHTYTRDGTFTVTLTVETAGGVTASTTTTIEVGDRNASLQFDGASFAILPLGGSQEFETCTFEAWVKMESAGGFVAAVGNNFALELVPSSNSALVRTPGQVTTATASGLADNWRHVAVTFQAPDAADPNAAPGTATLYINGAVITTAEVNDTFSASQITLGNAMRGKIAEVRFWISERTAEQISTNMNRRVAGTETGLLGLWRLDAGSGQSLENSAGGSDGTLGSSTNVEASDPAWSSEGPPI